MKRIIKYIQLFHKKGEKGEQKVNQTSRKYQDDRLKWQDDRFKLSLSIIALNENGLNS